MKNSFILRIWQYSFRVSFPKGIILSVFFVLCGAFLGQQYVKKIAKHSSSTNTQKQELAPIASISPNYQGKLRLFVLAGQSNMSGLGQIRPGDQKTLPQAYVFGNDYHWHLAKHPIDSVINQVDQVSKESKPPGVGPGFAFAKHLLEQNPKSAIGLIPCAKGGSTIAEWQRSLEDNTLYGSCLKRIQAASVMGDIEGVLFFQGEADAVLPERLPGRSVNPNAWAQLFGKYVFDLRQDLNQGDLPVVFAQIATTTSPDILVNWEQVKAQQKEVKLPAVKMITTDDLPLRDYVHFTSESYDIIGQRFAQTYLPLSKL